MADFLITWKINIAAETPREAIKEALKIHRDEDSLATIFAWKNLETGERGILDAED